MDLLKSQGRFKFKYCQSIYMLILVDFHFHHHVKAFTSGTVTEKEPTLYQHRHCKTQEDSIGREFAFHFYGVFASLLHECTSFKSVTQVHAYILTNGLEQDISLAVKLLNLYTMRGHMENARLIFDRIRKPNLFLWNAMIRGYAKIGPCEEALKLYYRMQQAGVQPDNFTFPFLLKACASLSALQEGKKIHEDIIRGGFESDVFVGSALIHMYTKCRSIDIARKVFDKMCIRDVVSWNAMVAGYSQNGHPETVLGLFDDMRREDVAPDRFTMVSVIQACTHLGALQRGMWIHDYITRSGFESDVFVGTALIDMYAKCRSIDIAFAVFDKMLKRDVVSWNAMISGYVVNGNANEALMLLRRMQLAGIKPDFVTMVNVLPACAQLAAVQQGKWIHGYIIRTGFVSDIVVATALMDMYAKCGKIELARQFFDEMSKRDIVSWNSMVAGYGMHGYGEHALELFSQMQLTGLKPNHITFVAILSACSHAGLVDKGWQYFLCMDLDYSIMPRVEHYACMVDLLGRAGCLYEAEDFIKNMPIEPSASVWGALLGACKIHCNIQLGEHAAECLVELEPENVGCYVLMSNIYAMAGRWDGVEKVRKIMKDRGLKKIPGCSYVELNKKVYCFLTGDRSHAQTDEIYEMLETLAGKMKEAGYAPNTTFTLHNVEDEVKEHLLCSHSEKLAIAFALINTNLGSTIQITKNLRVCDDCHNATKFISRIVKREIIVRDANRFHHFKDGLCSCGDYW